MRDATTAGNAAKTSMAVMEVGAAINNTPVNNYYNKQFFYNGL